MKFRMLRHAWIFVVLMSFAQAQDYTITNIGWLPGLFHTNPFAINGSGQVVGLSHYPYLPFQGNAFLWTKGVGIQDLGPGIARALNDSGDVTGSFTGCVEGAFLWKRDGGLQCSGVVPGEGMAINRYGDVAGVQGWPNDAFFWSTTTGVQYFQGGHPWGINDAGQVVGFTLQGFSHAFLWTEATGLKDLGTLGGDYSFASAINNSGQVVGGATPKPGDTGYHPFLWTQAGGMQDLSVGTIWADSNAIANAINNKGQIVGWIAAPLFHAALWTVNGVQDLNDHIAPDAGWSLDKATAINDAGQIAVTAYKVGGNRQVHALILSPKMTTNLISWRNPSFVGQTVRFKATVTNPIQGPPPNGETVIFTSGITVLGTGTLYKGVAHLSTSSLTAGTHPVKATYVGNVNYDKAASTVIQQVVKKWPTQTNLVSSSNPSNYRQAVTLTATVQTQGPTPTGRIVFRNGASVVASVSLTGGTANLTIRSLPIGTNLITALYQGSPASLPSTSAVLSQSVN